MKLFKVLLLTTLLAAVLAGCSIDSTPTASVESPVPTSPAEAFATISGYPASNYENLPTVPNSESYPAPDVEASKDLFPESIEVPTPSEGMAVVTGHVLEKSNEKPYLAPSLILGELVYSNDKTVAPLIGYSVETDPVATQDRTGKFVFKDVKPGEYAIVVWTPNSQTLITDRQNVLIVVNTEAGQTLDLGKVYVP